MKKKPKAKAVVIPGGVMRRPAPARAARPKPVVVIPGGVMQPVPAKKTVAKKKTVKRKLALGEAVACCAAEALAASLRLAGWPVTDKQVVNLYRLTAADDDEGATILATLEAAAEHGLGSVRPLTFREVMPHDAGHRDRYPGLHETRAGLILGADLPGPHALCDDGAAWWSWGQPYDPATFPGAVIEEAWAVTWPS